MYSLEQIEKECDDIVKDFYNMNDNQRKFITKLVENENVKWTRIELMKILMIFNKSVELGCKINSEKINLYSKFIDDNSKIINNYLNISDNKFRIGCGVA